MRQGQVASQGLALGTIVHLERPKLTIPQDPTNDPSTEKERLKSALLAVTEDLKAIKERMAQSFDAEHLEIIEAHIQMVNDPEIKSQTEAQIDDRVNRVKAYQAVTDQFITLFESMEDDYFKARAADIQDVQYRVLARLLDQPLRDVSHLDEASIIVAHDLTPSDTATMDYRYVQGFVTEVGGVTSHTAIMARALGIPAWVGVLQARETYPAGQTLLLDSERSLLVLNPSETEIEAYHTRKHAWDQKIKELDAYINQSTQTQDGHPLPLWANIGSPDDVPSAQAVGAEGVGLFRSEFLFMASHRMPSLDEQITAYRSVFDAFDTVIVRTLDIGGDKKLPYLNQPDEDNPFLGVRALRLTLQNEALFKTQLKALLIASAPHQAVYIMFPMVAVESELDQALAVLERVKKECETEKRDYQKNIKVGIMIEIPAAALNAERLAQKVDFMSIGSNDLIQYVYAADRMNEAVSYLYQPYDATLLRLIHSVITAAHRHHIPVGVCGEMGGDVRLALTLIGLGIDELSMQPSSILAIRKALTAWTLADLQTLAQNVLTLSDAKAVEAYLKKSIAD